MAAIWEIEKQKISSNLSDKIIQFYGDISTRKTTVAAHFPDSLVLGFEKGYQCISGIYAIPVDSWAGLKDIVLQLKDKRAKDKFKTIVIDTTRIAYDLCLSYLLHKYDKEDISEIGSKGKGWTVLKKEFSDVLNAIPKLGYGLVLITHATETIKGDSIVIDTDLDKTSSDVINKLVDFQFYVRKEDTEDGTTTVFAYTDVAFAKTKNRFRHFPKHFEFTYENLLAAYEEALEGERKDGAMLVDGIQQEDKFKELQNDVIQRILALGESEAVSEYISTHFDVRLSEADESYYDKFVAARDYLIGLGE